MEKAYIRSLAEIDAKVVAGSRRLRPLLADLRRATLYGYAPGPPVGGLDRCSSTTSMKKVAIGHKKTLVLDLDETLISTSRKPCDCDYKVDMHVRLLTLQSVVLCCTS